MDSIVQQWENHCLAEERSDGNRSRRFRSFYKEVFETFPNAPPLRYSEETINRALTVQHPHAQNLSYKGEGPWKKRAELRKTKLGKWLGKKVFIREAKSKKSKFTPLSETNDVPRPGQLVGSVRFSECVDASQVPNLGEVTHLSAEALATALRLGFNQVWMIDSSKRIEDEIVVPTPRGCVNWSVTPRGQDAERAGLGSTNPPTAGKKRKRKKHHRIHKRSRKLKDSQSPENVRTGNIEGEGEASTGKSEGGGEATGKREGQGKARTGNGQSKASTGKSKREGEASAGRAKANSQTGTGMKVQISENPKRAPVPSAVKPPPKRARR